MELITVWVVLWLVIWGSFNSYFKWKIQKTGNRRYFFTALFFLSSTLAVYLLFKSYLNSLLSELILGWVTAIFIGFFCSFLYPYYKHIKNGRYFLVSLASNILLQQTMCIVAINLLVIYFGQNYIDIYFAFVFTLLHLPVLFFKWAKWKYFILLFAFFGGFIFSYLLRNYSNTGAFISLLLHYCVYIPVFYYLRDERKI